MHVATYRCVGMQNVFYFCSTYVHAFSCPCGSFPTACHNDLHDLTTSLLSEVCSDVSVELALQPLDHEPLQYATANQEGGSQFDVVVQSFWGRNWHHTFLILECLTHLYPPILTLHCLHVILHVNE